MSDRQPLRDYRRSRAVLIGTSDYFHLPEVPAAANSLGRMHSLLTGDLCGWPRNKVTVFGNEASPGELPDRLITLFENAEDIALFYFVGHGQIDLDDQLCLGLVGSRSEPNRRAATSLQFASVRRAMLESPAATKIVILDCCFAGLASSPSNTLGTPDYLLDKAAGTGAYTMAASGAYTSAWFEMLQGAPQTYFTKYLADLVEAGIPGQPSGIRLRPLFIQLRENLARDRHPQPVDRNVDTASDFIFAHNAAPPDLQVDHEREVRQLRQRITEMEAEAAIRTRELVRLQEARNSTSSAKEQERLVVAVEEAGRRLDEATAAHAAAEVKLRDVTTKEQQALGLAPAEVGSPEPHLARKRYRWNASFLATILTIVIVLAACGVGVAAYEFYLPGRSDNYSGSGAGQVTVQVLPGETATSLAPRLVKLGVVASATSFTSAAKNSSNPEGLEPGFFRLRHHMNSALAYALLLNPSSRIQSVITIPAGLRETQILATLEQKTGTPASKFTAALKDTAALGLPSYANGNPEGYLFPATYDFNPGTSALTMLQVMLTRYNQEAASIKLTGAAQHIHLTEGQVITVASIVQAEATNPKYYAQIAEVIYNRLNLGMFLGLDSTVNYALHRFGVSLTNAQLQVNSPYNTFIHPGLPPGPIDSPGNAAIEAALHPAHGDLLYFVTVNLKTGLTLFTNSPAQYQQYETECNQSHAC